MGVAGFLGGRLNEHLSKDSKMTIILMVAGITFVYALLVYALKIITLGIPIELLAFLRIVAIEALYNVMIVIIIYPLLKISRKTSRKSIYGEKNNDEGVLNGGVDVAYGFRQKELKI